MGEIYRSKWTNMIGYVACVSKFSDGTQRSIYQHREVMENHLGRKLTSDEVVHHLDHVKSNNILENLEVMSRAEHARLHGLEREPELYIFNCPECKEPAIKLARNVRGNKKKNNRGPFCGRSCAGKHAQRYQGRQRESEILNLICKGCQTPFTRLAHVVRSRKRRGISNHFCSSSCSAIFQDRSQADVA